MHPRKPLSHDQQLVRLKRYLGRSRTELRHRYDELFEATKGRRDCPLEVRVRRRMIEHFQDAVSLLEACVEEMKRQEAMFYAPFKPGDRITVDRIDGRALRTASGPFLVVDIFPDTRYRYSYECVALTKNGAMYKRAGQRRVWPDADSIIQLSNAPLNDAGRWEAEYFRRCANTSRDLAFSAGDTTLFEARKAQLFGAVSYRRKDRFEP